MKQEIFKDIPGYEGLYQVSNLGRVKSLHRTFIRSNNKIQTIKERILKPFVNHKGYNVIALSKKCVLSHFTIHSLVLLVFIGKKPHNLQTRHLDGNKKNNNLNNLCYGTPRENADDKIKHGHISHSEKHPSSKLKNKEVMKIKRLIKQGITYFEISKSYPVNANAIRDIAKGRTWNHL